MQSKTKNWDALGATPSSNKHDIHTPQQAWKVWHQGLAIMYMCEQPLTVAT